MENTRKRLTRSYMLAIGLIALLLLVSQFLVQGFLVTQEEDGRIVNIAGRQRMLSQKIAKASVSLVQADNTEEWNALHIELDSALNLFNRSHLNLTGESQGMGFKANNTETILTLFKVLNPHHKALISNGKELLALQYTTIDDTASRSQVHQIINEILRHEQEFLPLMNAIVFAYDAESKGRVTLLSRMEGGIFVVGILLLILVIALIFRPMTDAIARSQEDLQASNQQLLASEEEIRQNAEELMATNQMLDEQKTQLENAIAFNTAVLKSAGFSIIATDLHGRITSFNQAAENTLLYTSDEVIGIETPLIFHDSTELVKHAAELSTELGKKLSPGMETLRAKAIKDGIEVKDWTYIRKDGKKLPVELTSTLLTNAQDEPIGFLMMARDISEHKANMQKLDMQKEELMASEEELRQNLEELQTTQEQLSQAYAETRGQLRAIDATIGYVEFDLKRNISRANNIFANWVDYSVEELQGMDHRRLVKEDYAIGQEYKVFWSELLKGNTKTGVYERIAKNGKTVWFHASYSPILNENNEVVKIIKLAVDYTKQRQVMEDIKAMNEELVASEEELTQNAEELLSTNERVREEKQKAEQAMMALQEAQNKLVQSEKMSSLGQLTAGVAHEINNPVNFISGGSQTLRIIIQDLFEFFDCYLELEHANDALTKAKVLEIIEEKKQELGTKEELEEDAKALMKDIDKGVNRVVEIVQGLKNFSRTDGDKPTMADLHDSIESTLLILNNKYKDRGIEIIKNYDENLPQIECYAGQLGQVFMNIIGNAIDAIEGKGSIKIETQNLIDIVEVIITDSGIGISESVRSRIFDPFFTTKDVGAGTGLGLSISHGIIERHQGVIEVASVIGEGTTFTIRLPKTLISVE